MECIEIEVVVDEKETTVITDKPEVDVDGQNNVVKRKHATAVVAKETGAVKTEPEDDRVAKSPPTPPASVAVATKTVTVPGFQWYLITYPTILIYAVTAALSVVCYTGW